MTKQEHAAWIKRLNAELAARQAAAAAKQQKQPDAKPTVPPHS